MKQHARILPLGAFVFVVMVGSPSFAPADVVAARGRQPLVSTQVLRLHEGRLICRGEGGAEIGFPIEQVEYIQITGWQMFDLAEKQRRADDWRRAAVSYERALADLQLEPAAATDTLDRVLLVKCRLVPAWDAQARFDRAVELYLEVVERMPQVGEGLKPSHFPETGSAVLEMAAKQVDAAIQRHGEDDVARMLVRWKSAWPARSTASAPATAAAPVVGEVNDGWGVQIRAVADWVQAGRNDQALAKIKEMHTQVSPLRRAELFYWQGRALEAMIAAAPGSSRSELESACARAIVAYMRVVVHFPRHPMCAECLYRAAQLCRGAGDREGATGLWSELIAVYPQVRRSDGKLWADLAREELRQ